MPAVGNTYRSVTRLQGRTVETVLCAHPGGWLLYRADSTVRYALLDVNGQARDSALPTIDLCVGKWVSYPDMLTVTLIDNPITRRPLQRAFVDALSGPDRKQVANVSGAKSDSLGVARLPRNWEQRYTFQQSSPSLSPRDTTPLRFVTRLRNGRDTVLVFDPRKAGRSMPDARLPGPAQILQVKYAGVFTDVPIDTAALPRDLTLSLGLGLRRVEGPTAIRRKGRAVILTWLGERVELLPSAVPAPAGCQW